MIPWKKNSENPVKTMVLVLIRFYLIDIGFQYRLMIYRRPYDITPKKYQKDFWQWCNGHPDDASDKDWIDEWKDFEWVALE